ncbi:SET domain-containing protein 4 isoform X2 [Oenanthe melanoleuca]|uniref:SET domain-containing protein 4 isoform X2 n=1 Tax=Oenanthe melanoleuca TaxID=2939378 RepID=UPI0024C1D114|nr:SET domain-containing protein 4 isoform X2 [Oenanthe melanoleuca]
MKKSRGRTGRRRRRKHLKSFKDGVNCSHKLEYIKLKKWLKERGFEDSNLRPAEFWETGRGLMTTKALQTGDLIISLPEKCLLTTSTVLSSCLGGHIVNALEWAWCTINTRTIYMKHPHRECFSLEPDVYALAPYLDLLNHSPNVQVKAAFNEQTRSYEIWTNSQCKKYQEVFICYGPHDNQRLLLEYGFVAMDNPHSSVYVSPDTLLKYFSPLDKERKAKVSILKDHNYLENLNFGWEGPSWRLLTALKVLRLAADEFACWRRILLGDVTSARNEQQALGTAAKICQFLTEETQHVLLQISQLKREKENLKSHLALVEMLHSENLKILQKSAEILCNLNLGTT